MAGVSLEGRIVLQQLQQGPVLLIYSFMPCLEDRAANPDDPVLEDLLTGLDLMPVQTREERTVQLVPVLQIGEARNYGDGLIGLGKMYLDEICESTPMVGITPIRRLSITIKKDNRGKHAVILIGNLGMADDHDRFYRTVDRELPFSHFERELGSAKAGTSALLNKIVEFCITAMEPEDLGQIGDLEDLHGVNGVGNDSSNRENSEEDVNTLAIPRGPLWWLEEILDQVADWWSGKGSDDSEDSELEAA